MAVFCDVAPCSLVDVHRHFRGAYCVQHQGITFQKTAIFIRFAVECEISAVITSSLYIGMDAASTEFIIILS
jgi:hypothetical protein